MMRIGIAFLFLVLAIAGWAEEIAPPRVETAPVIDGYIEDAWRQATVVSGFRQRFPREGAEATERTEVLVLYTTDALYIAFKAYDSKPEHIVGTVLKRDDDNVIHNDQFAMAIDSHNDGRSGFWFSTNPLGVRVDSQFFDEGDIWEPNWDGIWRCSAITDAEGWSAELEIPFATLRFEENAENLMGINFFRRIIRTNESLFDPLIPLSYSNGTPNVSIATKYRFTGIHAGRDLQIKPYLVSGAEDASGQNADMEGKAGLDLQYPITGGFTSYFSLNTDFAEAEADELQVNLTRFPLFLPEKRDFFLENAGDFQFGVPQETELFFSRRIGLSEDGDPVPVLFGARAAGKLGRLDLGILDVQTREDGASPSENFSTARFRYAVASRSYVGGIFTGRYTGGNLRSSWGADVNFHLGANVYFSGFASTLTGDHGVSGGQNAFQVALARGGEATSFRFAYLDVGAGYFPAVGFVRRNNIRNLNGRIAVPVYLNANGIRSITPGIQAEFIHDHAGVLLDSLLRGNVSVQFASEDGIALAIRNTEEFVPEPFPVFRDITVPAGRYRETRAELEAATKAGRSLSGSILLTTGGFYDGSRNEVSPTATYRWGRHFQFSQSVAWNFVDIPGESFTLVLSRTRITYALNTHLSAGTLIQYDNDLRETSVNLRLGYQFREGTELFVVFDHGEEEATLRRSSARLLLKFTYLF